jgi:DNA-binding NtrC family response regulator
MFKPHAASVIAHRPTVVIIEDDRPIMYMYRQLFDDIGYNVAVFDAYDACREFLHQNRCDLLIVDVIMFTDRNGLDILQTLYTELGNSLPPAIISSGCAQYQYMKHPILRQIRYKLLPKPFELFDMIAVAEELMLQPVTV